MAECQCQITERVEGLVDRGERKLYRELQAGDPNMRAKTRDFRTTGVVLRVAEPWFTQKGVKERIADVLRSLLLREYSISPSDVDVAATNVAMIRDGRREAVVNAIVLYDATNGSLRLSEPAYAKIRELLDRLRAAMELTPGEADLLSPEHVTALCAWTERLQAEPGDAITQMLRATRGEHPEGWLQIYAPGSRLAKRDVQGVLTDIEIIEPEILSLEGPPKLFYRYRVEKSQVKALVAAEAIEAVGDEWQLVYWNPETGQYQDTLDDLVVHESDRPINLSDSVSEPEV